MTKPTTIRLPDDLVKQLDQRARSRGEDRASVIRDLLRAGLAREIEEETLAAYRERRISLSEGAARLGLDLWSWFDLLRRNGESVNVEMEDWIDSREAL